VNEQQFNEVVVLGLVAAFVALIYYRKPWRPSSSAHGTARWATVGDLKKAGMIGKEGEGLLIGRTDDEKAEPIWLKDYVHLGIFARTGAGKGVSYCIPWLLTWRRGSVIVLDPKGELYEKTADARRAMGQKVIRLDPFRECGGDADTWNPLDLTGDGPEGIDAARAIANALIVRTGEEKDPHFNDKAEEIMTGAITVILAALEGKARSFGMLRQIIADPALYASCAQKLIDSGGVYANLGHSMKGISGDEKASVLSTAARNLQFLDSPSILPALASGWDARELLRGNSAVYVILPAHQMDAQARYLRLIFFSLLRLVGMEKMRSGAECLALMDEAGQLLTTAREKTKSDLRGA
jgi:type IV secretion system protein VirD4